MEYINMSQKPFTTTSGLSSPDYTQLFNPPSTGRMKSRLVKEQETSQHINYKEVKESLQDPDYKELFSHQEGGDLVKVHVYKR